jgi:site-specific recombinase XerD
MSKSGQARVLTPAQFAHVLAVAAQHRYPEKNTALLQISYKLGLRVQEIALLQIKEIATLGPLKEQPRSFKLHEIMPLPAAYTKGADALGRSVSRYERKRVSFAVEAFDQIVRTAHKLGAAGAEVNPADYYPALNKHKGKSRDLPMKDAELIAALEMYLRLRLTQNPRLKKTDSLFMTQKGGPYSPHTLQEHITLMQREWAGIERASSHSGRRTLLTNVIHGQGKSVKIAQKIAGHVSASTTLIYEEPPEESIANALEKSGKDYSES